jgi:hypothetical protein
MKPCTREVRVLKTGIQIVRGQRAQGWLTKWSTQTKYRTDTFRISRKPETGDIFVGSKGQEQVRDAFSADIIGAMRGGKEGFQSQGASELSGTPTRSDYFCFEVQQKWRHERPKN